MKVSQFTLGTATETDLAKLVRDDTISSSQARDFKVDCKCCIVSVIRKVHERIPMKSPLLMYLTAVDPSIIVTGSTSSCINLMKCLSRHFYNMNLISNQKSDATLQEYM